MSLKISILDLFSYKNIKSLVKYLTESFSQSIQHLDEEYEEEELNE
jgi:hypothetical protein